MISIKDIINKQHNIRKNKESQQVLETYIVEDKKINDTSDEVKCLLEERTFTNEDKQIFYNYLKQHNIGQIVISHSLQRFNRIKKIYGLQDYTSEYSPCLYFGVYVPNELMAIKRHRGKKYVMFGGTDCDWRSTLSVNIMRKLKRMSDITYIAISKDIETRLKKPDVKNTYLHLDLVNIK